MANLEMGKLTSHLEHKAENFLLCSLCQMERSKPPPLNCRVVFIASQLTRAHLHIN